MPTLLPALSPDRKRLAWYAFAKGKQPAVVPGPKDFKMPNTAQLLLAGQGDDADSFVGLKFHINGTIEKLSDTSLLDRLSAAIRGHYWIKMTLDQLPQFGNATVYNVMFLSVRCKCGKFVKPSDCVLDDEHWGNLCPDCREPQSTDDEPSF